MHMRSPKVGRGVKSAAVLLSAGLVLAACGGDDGEVNTAGGTSPGEGKAECESLVEFGDLSGTEVSVYASIVAPEDVSQKDSYKLFEECTGAKVVYEGSKEFEAQIIVRVKSGNPPDIAYVPQPGLLQTLVRDTGKVVAAPETVATNVDEFFGEGLKADGSVDDTFYAAPLGANVKSFVWYSPKMFADNGWEIPETWDEHARPVRHDRRHRHQALVHGHRLRRGDRMADDRLARGRHAAHRRSRRLRPVGQPRDPVQRPAGRAGARPGRRTS